MRVVPSDISRVITEDDFRFFREIASERAGISLADHKWTLVQSRLQSRLVALSLRTFNEYREHLQGLDESDPEWQRLINQLTTNKTDWFREPERFEILVNDFLPRWKKLGKRTLNVWCAASSSGEEPYTLSMVLARAFAGGTASYDILASDIDTDVLAQARNAVYPAARILEQVPSDFVREAFQAGTGEIADWMRVREPIRSAVRFARIHLGEIPGNVAGTNGEPFDLVFCRNVFIYFDAELIRRVVRDLGERANARASLVISHSETLPKDSAPWVRENSSLYTKRSK